MDLPRMGAMRWPFGSRPQITWSFALIALRMLIFGAVLLGVLQPFLTAGEVRRTGTTKLLLEDAILALLAIAFVGVFLFGVARASWRDLGLSRERLGRNIGLGVLTFVLGLFFIALRSKLDGGPIQESVEQVLGYCARCRAL